MIREHEDESVQLLVQRRMRPAIADLIRTPLYPKLRDAPSVEQYPPLRGVATNVTFVDHDHHESQADGRSSYMNEWEADMVVALAGYFVRQGYRPTEIAILTPYVGQLLTIRDLLKQRRLTVVLDERDVDLLEKLGEDPDEGDDGGLPTEVNTAAATRVRLATVDNFQGEEADIVLISTVRNNDEGRAGFLKVTNRVNVMLSRARHGMIILGSATTLRRTKSAGLCHSVLDTLERQGAVQPSLTLRCDTHGEETLVTDPSDVPIDGGCDRACDAMMECGHACERRCHPDDRDHRNTARCRKPCVRIAPCGIHPCVRLCLASCECRERTTVSLPCGHEASVLCSDLHRARSKGTEDTFLAGEADRCKEPVYNVTMNKCGHTVDEMRCGDVHAQRCTKPCGEPLGCHQAHGCSRACHECRALAGRGHSDSLHTTSDCRVKCERTLMCGHVCNSAPCHAADECPPCSAACPNACSHSRCRAKCQVPCTVCAEPCLARCTNGGEPHVPPCDSLCGLPCTRPLCSEPCDKKLSCGHPCPSLCGEQCVDAAWCPRCARTAGENAEKVVDVITFETLASVEVDVRLLRLDCGHVFTVETLDEATGLKHYFNLETGEPVDLSAIPPTASSTQPRCPSVDKPCTATISGPTRYRRPVALARLGLAQRKWKVQQGHKLAAWRVEVVNVLRELTVDKGGRMLEALLTKQRLAISRVVSGSLDAVKTAYETSPTQDVFGKLTAQQARTGDGTRAMLHVRAGPDSAVLAAASTLRLRVTHLQIIQRLVTSQAAHAPRQGKAILQCVKKVCAPTLRVLQTLADLKAATSCALLADELVAFADTTLRLVDGAALPGKEAVRLREVLGSQLADHIVEVSPATDVAALRVADRPRLISDEERLLILKALEEDVGSGLGSFGGHWYACSCGYEYAIGECGGALETIACPECGAVIGGENHHLADGNVQAADMLRVAGLEASPNFRELADIHLMVN